MIKEAIVRIAQRGELNEEEMRGLVREILQGQATAAQLGALVTALRMRGESVAEIVGAAKEVRTESLKIDLLGSGVNIDRGEINIEDETLMNTCTLGEDCTKTFNVSTATALVVAGAGLEVVKHGYRTDSSFCGSADVLEALGVNLDISRSDAQRCVNETGICFLYAPLFHMGMSHVAGPRREIGIRTIFNLISPLVNPAGSEYQVLGVYHPDLTEKMAAVLQQLGRKSAYVFCGETTLDEISICGRTRITRLLNGSIETEELSPEDFGLQAGTLQDIAGGNAVENARIIRSILQGEKGPRRDMVAVNAAAAFVITGMEAAFPEAIKRAEAVIDSGDAGRKLEKVIDFTRQCAPFVRKEL
ncbi:MAG: anthranilate phosphoribosyltransferase [Desulfohalobiaceae bacterium]|nr:anthranilate phosphoribosyltransferase [Desulfohalobiaceae bacterium]